MQKIHYTISDVREAIRSVVTSGDIIFVHSNIGLFGNYTKYNPSEMWLQELMLAVSPYGAVFVPTFTYSFCRGEAYNRDATPSNMGVFAEYVRTRGGVKRSIDPCYSVAGIGGDCVEYMLGGYISNSFSESSFFGKFLQAEGKIVNLNLNAGSTFIHYVERMLGVDYRFDKEFVGPITFGGITHHDVNHTIYVRKLEDGFVADFRMFDVVARARGLAKCVKLGRGEIVSISAKDTVSLIRDEIVNSPYFLTASGFNQGTVSSAQ
jgi:aminoglycoside 3-N-acetyltransferase